VITATVAAAWERIGEVATTSQRSTFGERMRGRSGWPTQSIQAIISTLMPLHDSNSYLTDSRYLGPAQSLQSSPALEPRSEKVRTVVSCLNPPTAGKVHRCAPKSVLLCVQARNAVPASIAAGLFDAQYMIRIPRIALMPPKAMRRRPSETL
jgi:hypothetical protein